MARAALILALLPTLVFGKFAIAESVPVDRLIENVKAHFQEYRNQADAFYLLGRLQSLKFSRKADAVSVFHQGAGEVPGVDFWSWKQEISKEASPQALSPDSRELGSPPLCGS